MTNIGDRIRQARDRLDISQEELAERVGKDQRVISQYENGRRRMFADDLIKFAAALQVPIAYFYSDADADDLDEILLNEFHLLSTRAAKETALDLVRVLRAYTERD